MIQLQLACTLAFVLVENSGHSKLLYLFHWHKINGKPCIGMSFIIMVISLRDHCSSVLFLSGILVVVSIIDISVAPVKYEFNDDV